MNLFESGQRRTLPILVWPRIPAERHSPLLPCTLPGSNLLLDFPHYNAASRFSWLESAGSADWRQSRRSCQMAA